MFLRYRAHNEQQYNNISARIRNDLMLVFKEKGINTSTIHIDTKDGIINITVCIDRNCVPDIAYSRP